MSEKREGDESQAVRRGPARPSLTPAAAAAKKAREARLAAELRANLRRRKDDLAARGASAEDEAAG